MKCDIDFKEFSTVVALFINLGTLHMAHGYNVFQAQNSDFFTIYVL